MPPHAALPGREKAARRQRRGRSGHRRRPRRREVLIPGPPRYTAPTGDKTMAAANTDMRVVIAGAGGRMGRTLIYAVAQTKGMVLAGAADAPDSAVIGRNAGG